MDRIHQNIYKNEELQKHDWQQQCAITWICHNMNFVCLHKMSNYSYVFLSIYCAARVHKKLSITGTNKNLPNLLLQRNPWRYVTIVNENFVDVVCHCINIRIVMWITQWFSFARKVVKIAFCYWFHNQVLNKSVYCTPTSHSNHNHKEEYICQRLLMQSMNTNNNSTLLQNTNCSKKKHGYPIFS